MSELKIKVCGMRDPENILGVVIALPDFMGLIFYPQSKRFAGMQPISEILDVIPPAVKKVGVFVNETTLKVMEVCQNWKLDVVQLHGQESPEYCKKIQESGATVFKAFSVDEQFDFEKLSAYSSVCNYFLFDTNGSLPGGTGLKFNWQLLENYKGEVPFFLSGGIDPGDLEAIKKFRHPMLYGIDINSGFEISPALKDVKKVNKFITGIRSLI